MQPSIKMTSLADAATRDGYFPGLSSSYEYVGAGNNGMAWDYSADGRKIKYTGLTNEMKYADGIEYLNDEEIFIYHPEGRVYRDSSGEWLFEFSLRDHLGNTRVVFADIDGDGIIVEVLEAHYYPLA